MALLSILYLVLGLALHGALGQQNQTLPKQLAAVRRRSGLTHKEFLIYHTFVHGLKSWNAPRDDSFAAAYTLNYVFDSVFGVNNSVPNADWVGRDDVAELWSSTPTTFTASSNYTDTVIGPDGTNFNDKAVAFSIIGTEIFLLGSESSPVVYHNPIKGPLIAYFWTSSTSDSVSNETFARTVTESLLSNLPDNTAYRASIHVPLPGVDVRPYFGGEGLPTISSVIKLWLYDTDTVVSDVRAAQSALNYTSLHLDENVSFFVFTRAVTIWDLDKGLDFNETYLRAAIRANTY